MSDVAKNIVYLSKEQFSELIANGAITVDGTTVTYNENDLYVTPQAEPVTDVKVNGISIVVKGIANVPVANAYKPGVVIVGSAGGLYLNPNNAVLQINYAPASLIKAGVNNYQPITPGFQHESTFYGLAKAAGDATQSKSSNAVGTYTDEAKAAIRAMLGVSVEDVQIDGASVVDHGVASVPIARSSSLGVVKAGTSNRGISVLEDGSLHISMADNAMIKEGYNSYRPIVPNSQHVSTFYGLAKAAGVDMAASSNRIGTYTEEARTAIRSMLGLDNQSIVDIVQAGLPAAEGVAF